MTLPTVRDLPAVALVFCLYFRIHWRYPETFQISFSHRGLTLHKSFGIQDKMNSRKYLVCVLVAVLLKWGPQDRSWPAWQAIRFGSLIAIPVAARFLLEWIWRIWQPDAVTENRFERALGGATAGVFLVLAILSATADTHIGNTEWIQTHDGMEAVGDDLVLPGPNWVNAMVLLAIAGFAFRFSVDKSESEP